MTDRGPITPESVAQAVDKAVAAVSPQVGPAGDGRVVEDNFDTLPTHRPGLRLLVEHGVDADRLTRAGTERLQELGGPYVARALTIKRLEELQTRPQDGATRSTHDEIEDFGVNVPGLRGVRDEIAGWEVQITPSHEDIIDPDLVTQSGEEAAGTVHRAVRVSVLLDPDTEDVEGFIAAARRRLVRQGESRERAHERVEVDRTSSVEKDRLRKLVEAGKVVLLPGTWKRRIKNWSVVPRAVSSQAERDAVEEAVLLQGSNN